MHRLQCHSSHLSARFVSPILSLSLSLSLSLCLSLSLSQAIRMSLPSLQESECRFSLSDGPLFYHSGDPGSPYELGVVITNRSLVLGQTVHDKVLESPLINLVSNSVNNARFWYFDVPESIVSSAPIEIYVSGTDTGSTPLRHIHYSPAYDSLQSTHRFGRRYELDRNGTSSIDCRQFVLSHVTRDAIGLSRDLPRVHDARPVITDSLRP